MPPHSFAVPEHRPLLALNTLMNAGSRSIEPDFNSAGISLPAHSPNLTDPFGDLQTTGVNRSPNSSDTLIRPPRQEYPLYNWWTSQEKPWDPIGIQGRNPIVPRTGARLNYRPSGAAFSTYRSSHVPSECDTIGHGPLPSDSGYESLSRPRQSIVGGSIYGDCDRSGDTASVSNGLAGLQFDRPMPPPDIWRQQGSVHAIDVSVNSEGKNLVCPHCNDKVKTKSELKKHKQKHEKPYHCTVLGCKRTEGFSTSNDVDRHTRSRHPEQASDGKYYGCTIQGCRSKEKKWPRADNFRQHLKRVHKIPIGLDDIGQYVYKEHSSPGPELAGLGTSVGDGLLPADISHDASVLSPAPWTFLQAAQEDAARDSSTFTNYQQMFQQGAVTTQQQLELISPTTAADEISSTLMQMNAVGLGPETALPHLERPDLEQQDQQDLTDPSNGDQDMEGFETNYFNDASMPENETEEETEPHIQHLGELTSPQGPCDESGYLEHPTEQSVEARFIDRRNGDSPNDAISVDDDDNGNDDDSDSSSTSTSLASSPSGGHDRPHISSDTIPEQLEEANATKASLDGSDIISYNGKTTDLLKALEDKGALAELLAGFGYQKPKEAEFKAKTPSSARSDASKTTHICTEPGCRKGFPRACELKKHMKRHVKPYGCTFPQCQKRFGSKNDWKRHENGQHYQLELWKCDEKSVNNVTELCGKTCDRREQFKIHLEKDHRIEDPAIVNFKLEHCLDGRNYGVSFWCGFCRKTVEVKDKGPKACMWIDRSNHVDDHFTGQNGPKMDISEWKNPDPGLPEVAFVLIGPEEASQRESSGSISAPSAGAETAGRPAKRPAGEDTQQPKLPKKARVSGVWYCCGCGEQYNTGFSAACLSSICNGHKQCDNCRLDAVRSDKS